MNAMRISRFIIEPWRPLRDHRAHCVLPFPDIPALRRKLEAMEVLYGLHPVGEAIRSRGLGRPHLDCQRTTRCTLDALLALAKANKVRISHEGRDQLTRMAKSDQHQGAIAFLRERKQLAIEDLLTAQKPEANTGSFWPWTAWKTRITWVLCCHSDGAGGRRCPSPGAPGCGRKCHGGKVFRWCIGACTRSNGDEPRTCARKDEAREHSGSSAWMSVAHPTTRLRLKTDMFCTWA